MRKAFHFIGRVRREDIVAIDAFLDLLSLLRGLIVCTRLWVATRIAAILLVIGIMSYHWHRLSGTRVIDLSLLVSVFPT